MPGDTSHTAEPDLKLPHGTAIACLLTAAGASLDSYVYLAHGHVLANAQTGNVVLFAIHLADGQTVEALRHIPSFLAFCIGVIASRLGATALRRRGFDSRPIRLTAECAALLLLAHFARAMPDRAVVICVAFLAAFQISSYSHFGGWTFNTGMTTGNLWNGLTAFTNALTGEADRASNLRKSAVLAALVGSFILGALAGAAATIHWHDHALQLAAAVVGAAIAIFGTVRYA